MWAVSAQFLQAIAQPGRLVSTATHRNLYTGVKTPLIIDDGTVTVDATVAIRRTLSLTVPGLQSTFDTLDTPGGEITVKQIWIYDNGDTETIPLGVFIVDQDALDYSPQGEITMTCPDRWLKIQRNRFGLNRSSVASNLGWQEIQRLVEACWSGAFPFPGWSQLDKSANTKVGSLLWDDGQRDSAILAIAQAASSEAFFDALGQSVLRPVPVLSSSSPPVWTVKANTPDAMLTAASRDRDMSSVRNAVIVTTSATDVTFPPVEVKNTTAGDPLNVSGSLGYVPYDYSSPLLRNSAQARAAGLTILSKQLGVAKQLTMEAVSNPALDAEDVLKVMLPDIDTNTPRPSELHIIDSVTHPLTPSGIQEITTRSTRPDTDGT